MTHFEISVNGDVLSGLINNVHEVQYELYKALNGEEEE